MAWDGILRKLGLQGVLSSSEPHTFETKHVSRLNSDSDSGHPVDPVQTFRYCSAGAPKSETIGTIIDEVEIRERDFLLERVQFLIHDDDVGKQYYKAPDFDVEESDEFVTGGIGTGQSNDAVDPFTEGTARLVHETRQMTCRQCEGTQTYCETCEDSGTVRCPVSQCEEGIIYDYCNACTVGYIEDPCDNCGGDGLVVCPKCDGTTEVFEDGKLRTCKLCRANPHGNDGMKTCGTCDGTGTLEKTCPSCGGEGKSSVGVCDVCPEHSECPDGEIPCEDCDYGTSPGPCQACAGTGKQTRIKCTHREYRVEEYETTYGSRDVPGGYESVTGDMVRKGWLSRFSRRDPIEDMEIIDETVVDGSPNFDARRDIPYGSGTTNYDAIESREEVGHFDDPPEPSSGDVHQSQYELYRTPIYELKYTLDSWKIDDEMKDHLSEDTNGAYVLLLYRWGDSGPVIPKELSVGDFRISEGELQYS